MTKKYHITDDGPKECSAQTSESCKYGGTEHYGDIQSAQVAYEEKMGANKPVVGRRGTGTDYAIPETIEEYEDGITYRTGSMYSDKLTTSQQLKKPVSDEVKKYFRGTRLREVDTSRVSVERTSGSVYINFDPTSGLEPKKIPGTPYESYDDVITDGGVYPDLSVGIRDNDAISGETRKVLGDLKGISSSFMRTESSLGHNVSSTPVIVNVQDDYERSYDDATAKLKQARKDYKSGKVSEEQLREMVNEEAKRTWFFLKRKHMMEDMRKGKGEYDSLDDIDRELARQLSSDDLKPSLFLFEDDFKKKAGIK